MIELTEEERELLSNLSKDPVLGLVEHRELRNLLARDAESRGKAAVSREGLASLVHKARVGQERDDNFTHLCDCEYCLRDNFDIAEAEAALAKEGE